MTVIYIVLPLVLIIAIGAIIAFIWAARSGQIDDLETPALRVLHEEDDSEPSPSIDAEAVPGSGNEHANEGP